MHALTTIIKEYKNINIFLILEKQVEMSTVGYKEIMVMKNRTMNSPMLRLKYKLLLGMGRRTVWGIFAAMRCV